MATEIIAKVGSLGEKYTDGTPNLEIWFTPEAGGGSSLLSPTETSITLVIDGREYRGAILANTSDHVRVWVSPKIHMGGTRLRLGEVLTAAGFAVGDDVVLEVSGTVVCVRAVAA